MKKLTLCILFFSHLLSISSYAGSDKGAEFKVKLEMIKNTEQIDFLKGELSLTIVRKALFEEYIKNSNIAKIYESREMTTATKFVINTLAIQSASALIVKLATKKFNTVLITYTTLVGMASVGVFTYLTDTMLLHDYFEEQMGFAEHLSTLNVMEKRELGDSLDFDMINYGREISDLEEANQGLKELLE